MAKRKVYNIKLTRLQLFLSVLSIILILLWMFIFGILVGQELIYFPSFSKIKTFLYKKSDSKSHKTIKNLSSPKQIAHKLKKEIPPFEVSPSKQLYALQIGAFKNKQNAQKFEKIFKNKGYKTFLKTVEINNITHYRVYIGPYPLKEILSIYDDLSSQKYSPTKPIPLP